MQDLKSNTAGNKEWIDSLRAVGYTLCTYEELSHVRCVSNAVAPLITNVSDWQHLSDEVAEDWEDSLQKRQ